MPGWTSFSDFINEVTVNGKYLYSVFEKNSPNAAPIGGGWVECYTWTGIPAAGPQTGVAGTGTVIQQSTQGTGIYIGANVTPDIRSLLSVQFYLANFDVPMTAVLVDFLAYWPSLVVNGAPTALTAAPLTRYIDGKGVMAIASVQTPLGAAFPQITMTCTYDDDTAAAAGTMTIPNASAPKSNMFGAGSGFGMPYASLPAGKHGIKAINSYVINAGGTTGTMCFFLVKPLGIFPVPASNIPTERDLMMQIPSLPRIYDNAHLGWLLLTTAVSLNTPIGGGLGMGWG